MRGTGSGISQALLLGSYKWSLAGPSCLSSRPPPTWKAQSTSRADKEGSNLELTLRPAQILQGTTSVDGAGKGSMLMAGLSLEDKTEHSTLEWTSQRERDRFH
jgi:hypothetical protein